MFNLFKRNKEPLNTVGHCGGNRGVIPERGHAPSPVQPKKQPYVRIEFDDINNPTVWLDGDKVEALETLDVNWVTDTDQKNTKKFEISYLDLNNPNGPFIKRGQTNMQSSRVGNADGKRALFGSTKDIEKIIECINEAKKDGSLLTVISGSLFGTDVNTLKIVLESMGYRCTTAKLAFEGEQVSERLIIIIEGDPHEDQKHLNRQ